MNPLPQYRDGEANTFHRQSKINKKMLNFKQQITLESNRNQATHRRLALENHRVIYSLDVLTTPSIDPSPTKLFSLKFKNLRHFFTCKSKTKLYTCFAVLEPQAMFSPPNPPNLYGVLYLFI